MHSKHGLQLFSVILTEAHLIYDPTTLLAGWGRSIGSQIADHGHKHIKVITVINSQVGVFSVVLWRRLTYAGASLRSTAHCFLATEVLTVF
jgi:hypothetical protein